MRGVLMRNGDGGLNTIFFFLKKIQQGSVCTLNTSSTWPYVLLYCCLQWGTHNITWLFRGVKQVGFEDQIAQNRYPTMELELQDPRFLT